MHYSLTCRSIRERRLISFQRLESNAKSPIFEQFGSVLAGIGTIRAFDKTDAYIERYVSCSYLPPYMLRTHCYFEGCSGRSMLMQGLSGTSGFSTGGLP